MKNKTSLLVLRLAIGWFFLYSGFDKVMNPEWTAAGFLGSAKTFPAMFSWFSSASNIDWVNALNAWGQLFIGVGLISGTLVRLASWSGVLLMLMYYLPGLDFPHVEHGFLVDDHVLYALVFFLLAEQRAGQYFGLDKLINKKIKSWWI